MTTSAEERVTLEQYQSWQRDRLNQPADHSIDAYLAEREADLNTKRIEDAIDELQNDRLEHDWSAIEEGGEILDHLHALIERLFNVLRSTESLLIDGREMIEDRTIFGDSVLRFTR